MKKNEFDYEPQLLEQEGSQMRISFDVESQVKEFPSMDGGEPQVRTIYLAHVVRVKAPINIDAVRAALVAAGCDEYHAEVIACQSIFVNGGSSDIDQAKAFAIARITEYDASIAVNEFTYNGHSMWLDDATRTKLAKRFSTDEQDGLSTTKLIYGGMEIELPIETAKNMLHLLESYARDCFDNTNAHKVSVESLTTVAEVLDYDYTTGYPPKLSF